MIHYYFTTAGCAFCFRSACFAWLYSLCLLLLLHYSNTIASHLSYFTHEQYTKLMLYTLLCKFHILNPFFMLLFCLSWQSTAFHTCLHNLLLTLMFFLSTFNFLRSSTSFHLSFNLPSFVHFLNILSNLLCFILSDYPIFAFSFHIISLISITFA